MTAKGAFITEISKNWEKNLRSDEETVTPTPGVLAILDLGHNEIDDFGFQYCLDILGEDIGLRGALLDSTNQIDQVELYLNHNHIKGGSLNLKDIRGLNKRLVKLSLYSNPLGK